MFAIARFNVPSGEEEAFFASVEAAREALANCDGYISGQVGRNTDDPALIALVTEWRNIGSYRRALSNYQVKMTAVPVLARAIDEPGGYITAGE